MMCVIHYEYDSVEIKVYYDNICTLTVIFVALLFLKFKIFNLSNSGSVWSK